MSSKKEPNKTKRGRPTKWNDDFINKTYYFMLAGKTIDELAEYLEVHRATIYDWIEEKPKFSDAITRARAKVDDLIEESLFKSAKGMTVKREVAFLDKRTGQIVKAEITEEIPPNVSAAKMWLHNRRPKDWKEKREVDVKGEGINILIGYGDNDEEEEEK